MRKDMRGSFTVEAAVVVPLILFVVGVLCYLLFYYHDKNVIMSAAHETTIYGSYVEELNEETLKTYMEERVKGNGLLFSNCKIDVEIKEEEIILLATSEKGPMLLRVRASSARTNPGHYIRSVQKMKKIGEKE